MADFTPFNKITLDINATIIETAKDRNIKKEDVDFDLLGVNTLAQTTLNQEWIKLDESVEKVYDENILKSNALVIRQEYKIRLRPYKQNTFFKNIDIKIASNKAKSKVVATFKKGTIFPCDANLAKFLKKEITRKKLRLGLLSGHFEDGLNATLVKLAKAIKCKRKLPKDIRITIASSPGPILSTDDSIVSHYKENSKKNLIEGVDKDELIFEYIKPKKGSDGRSCNGKFIIALEPKISYANYKPDEETVVITEDEKSVKYYSLVDGYVKDTLGVISISKELTLQSASFKNTGSIDTGDTKDILININSQDSSDDAIGTGVNIEVKELNVKGTVGSNTNIKANALNVGEQTHRNSKLEAVENAKVHLHRGNLKAKTAEIEILENGTVEADDVHVKKMLGGEIIGHRVIVEEITSNTVVIASELIEIDKITGEQNKLIIDPNKIEAYHKQVEEIREELKDKKVNLRVFKEKYSKDLAEHVERADRIKVFKKRIIAATKAGKTPNKADMIRIKQYKIQAQEIEKETKTLNKKENKIDEINTKLEKLYEAELHAKIKHKNLYDGKTQVIFVDVKTARKHELSPKGLCKEIYLKKDNNDIEISWDKGN